MRNRKAIENFPEASRFASALRTEKPQAQFGRCVGQAARRSADAQRHVRLPADGRRARTGNGRFEYNMLKLSTALPGIVFFFAILGLPATAIAQSNANYTQQVVRLNPKRDPGNKPAYTVADCFVSENCLPWLSRTILQVGGNPALLASATQEQKPYVSGDQSVYRFEALAGESFCKLVLHRPSLAPTFGAFAPELKFSASKKIILATVRLPTGDGAPKRAWFDGFLVLLSVKDVAFAESSCSLKEVAQEVACKGKCEMIRF